MILLIQYFSAALGTLSAYLKKIFPVKCQYHNTDTDNLLHYALQDIGKHILSHR